MSVSVCLHAYLKNQTSLNFPCLLPVAATRSSSDENPLRYVFPVCANDVQFAHSENRFVLTFLYFRCILYACVLPVHNVIKNNNSKHGEQKDKLLNTKLCHKLQTNRHQVSSYHQLYPLHILAIIQLYVEQLPLVRK